MRDVTGPESRQVREASSPTHVSFGQRIGMRLPMELRLRCYRVNALESRSALTPIIVRSWTLAPTAKIGIHTQARSGPWVPLGLMRGDPIPIPGDVIPNLT